MKKKTSRMMLATLTVVAALGSAAPAVAQAVGGTTTVDTSIAESTNRAMGWSVKRMLMGKTLYNDAGQKVGKVEDLIISPDKNLSHVIVDGGSFIGVGRHDVAIPVSRIQDQAGKLVVAGATKDTIKGLPEFTYASDTRKRDAFVAAADQDIAKGKAAVASLEKKAGLATADAKARLDVDLAALQSDLKSAEAKLAELMQGGVVHWRSFATDVGAATARLRKSTEKAAG